MKIPTLAILVLLFSGCTSAPVTVTPREQLIAQGVGDLISVGLVPVLVKNPDLIPAAQGVANALGSFAGTTLTKDDITAFVARTPLPEEDAKTVTALVTAAWDRYTRNYQQHASASLRPDVKLFLAAVADGIASAVAAVPKA